MAYLWTKFKSQNYESGSIILQVCYELNISMCVRKSTIWVPTRSDTNRAVQSQNMVKGWKFWISKVEELYYPCSENKGADQPRAVTAKLICAFVFAYADCWFSHAAAP